MRVPVSAPSGEPFPDVFAVKGNAIVAFEIKAHHKIYDYFKAKQVSKLFEFLEIHKIYPNRFAVVAAKFPRGKWFFKIADEPRDYMIKLGEGMTFQELLDRVEQRQS